MYNIDEKYYLFHSNITIKKSPTADTRTCDYKNVTGEQLLKSSKQHINDVREGLNYFAAMLKIAAINHDHTKISGILQFHKEFINGFKTTEWWDNHRKVERHHLSSNDGIPSDVDLIDVLEFIVDGVMAGLARSGEYRKEKIPEGLLQKAFNNTIDKLVKVTKVEE